MFRGRCPARKSIILILTASLTLSSCSAGKFRGVLATVFDGVPKTGAPAAEAPRTTAKPTAARPDVPLDPARARLAEPVSVVTAAPLESLRTWEKVLAALPVAADGGVDWVSALDRGLVAPRLLRPPVDTSGRPPTLETLGNPMSDDPRRPALDLDVQLRPEGVETAEAAAFYTVRFPHARHTTWLGCSSCHPGIRTERAGMSGILQGQFCGRCHGRVSFAPQVSCGRCHPNLVPPTPDALATELAAAGDSTAAGGSAAIERGATVFRQMCATCHGEAGDGKGPLSPWLDPKPRDFTAGKYKFRSTLPTSIPTDPDIFATITRGVPGTSMPAFAALPREDRWALTHYLKTLSNKFAVTTPQPIPMAPPPETTPTLVEMGRKLYVEAGCNLCHGDAGRGDGPSSGTLKDDGGNRLRPFNFASGRPLKAGTGPDAVYRDLMTGLQGTPMPGFGDALVPEQGWALVAYVQTFFGKALQPFAVKGDIEFRRALGAAASSDTASFPPARFPHWFHRIRFKCASCHPDIFQMRAGANAVSMTALRSGQFCGKCHNGSTAWEIGFNTCGKCHPGGAGSTPAPPDHGARVMPGPRKTALPTPATNLGAAQPEQVRTLIGPGTANPLGRRIERSPDSPPTARLSGGPPARSYRGRAVMALAGWSGPPAGKPSPRTETSRAAPIASTPPADETAPAAPRASAASRGSSAPYRWIRSGGKTALAGAWVVGQLFRTGKWKGENAATFEHDSRDVEGGLETSHFQRKMLRGEFSARNSDLILGSRRLTANVGVDLSYRSERVSAGEQSSPGTGRVVGYDLSLTAQPNRGATFGVFTARNHTMLPRLFGTTRDQLLTERGGQAYLAGPWLNSTLRWTRIRTESTARVFEGTRRDGEERTVLGYTGMRRTGRHTLMIEHRREQRDDLIDPDFSFPLLFTKLRYGIDLGLRGGSRSLVSNFGLSRRGGRQKRENLRGETRLDFRLRPMLSTRTTTRIERVELPGFARERRAIDFQVTHRLYESLITTASFNAAREYLPSGTRQLSGTDLLLEYRKKLLAGGKLSASAGRRWDRDDSRFDEREEFVQGESHEARIAAPFRIEHPRVSPSSLVITDAGETIVYREGVDYTVVAIGEYTEISILPEGLIVDGQTLLVDYRFQIVPTSRTRTKRSHLDVSVDYGWITPYFRLHEASRALIAGFDGGSPFDRTGRAAGMRCRFGREKLRLHLSGEWQADNAENLSFEAWQFAQTLSSVVGPDLTLTANLEQNTTIYRIPTRRESRHSAALDLGWQVTPGLSLRGAAAARKRRDTLGFGERVYRTSVDANWTRAALSLTTSLTHDWGVRDSRQFHGMWLSTRLSRMF